MSDNIIGLHLYKISIVKNREKSVQPVNKKVNGLDLREHTDRFFEKHAQSTTPNQSYAQNWYFSPKPNNENIRQGLIMYGSTGFESDIVDSKSRKITYKRQVTDIETIPLYYRFWVPTTGEYGVMALQTHGLRSCIGRVQHAFAVYFREANPGYHLDFKPIVPYELEIYRNSEVKAVSLTKKEMSSDSAENQLGKTDNLIDVDLTLKAPRSKSLGRLIDILSRLRSDDSSKAMTYNDISFDEASAEIVVGGRRRKVTLVGLSQQSGRLDITADIELQPNGHPKFESISNEVESILKSVVVAE